MEDRVSVSLSLRDPFPLRKSEREIRHSGVWEVRRSSQSTRSVKLSASYAFGGPRHRGR